MPQCPHCHVPSEPGQRYCSTCGSFLLHPEQGDTFCPQCDVRVSPRQEFCHECDAPLKEGLAAPGTLGTAAGVAAAAPEAPPAKIPPSGMPSWLMGVLVGAGILVIILLVLLFTRGGGRGSRGGSQSPGRCLVPFQGRIALMAEFLAGRDAHVALGAKGVPLFGMQQETAARAAITLAGFKRGLAVGALRHGGPPGRRNQVEANLVKLAHEIAKP
jgi:hypothetical protein